MKILFILGFTNPFPGAAWTRIGFFAEAWSKKGHSVEVLGAFSYKTLHKRGAKRIGRVDIYNFIFRMGVNHPLVFMLNSIVSFIVSTLFRLVKRSNVLIVSMPTGDVGLGALIACKLVKAKRMVDYRDEWEDYTLGLINSKMEEIFYSIVKKITTSVYAESQLVVAVTPNSMEALKRRGLGNVKLMPNGADVRVFKPLTRKKANKGLSVFYSGGIGGYYRLDVAVKALKILINNGLRDVKLVIAGDGEIQKIFNLALELDVVDNIEYKGPITDKTRLAYLINESDVGLIPYDDNPLWKNSLPAKFFEYCACGIPVVATTYADSLLAELIKNYGIGTTSPPMDEEKLAEAIYQLYKNESFREVAGKRARELVEDNFDRNKIAEAFLNLVSACA